MANDMTLPPLDDAVTTITGLTGAINYALGRYTALGDNSGTLRHHLNQLTEATDRALDELDQHETQNQPDATITQLHPPEPA